MIRSDSGTRGPLLGFGTDLCAIDRLARALAAPDRDVLTAMFTRAEIAAGFAGREPAGMLAACFAAKEAVVKALAAAGGQGLFWRDIEVLTVRGRPRVNLRGRLGDLAAQLGVRRILVSHARCRCYAMASALLLA